MLWTLPFLLISLAQLPCLPTTRFLIYPAYSGVSSYFPFFSRLPSSTGITIVAGNTKDHVSFRSIILSRLSLFLRIFFAVDIFHYKPIIHNADRSCADRCRSKRGFVCLPISALHSHKASSSGTDGVYSALVTMVLGPLFSSMSATLLNRSKSWCRPRSRQHGLLRLQVAGLPVQ